MSVRWRDHADHHMGVLLSPVGPFAKTSGTTDPANRCRMQRRLRALRRRPCLGKLTASPGDRPVGSRRRAVGEALDISRTKRP